MVDGEFWKIPLWYTTKGTLRKKVVARQIFFGFCQALVQLQVQDLFPADPQVENKSPQKEEERRIWTKG